MRLWPRQHQSGPAARASVAPAAPHHDSDSDGETKLPTCVASCLSLALLAAGTGSLAASVSNDRARRVAAYDKGVRRWMTTARPELKASRFSVDVVLSGGLRSSAPLEPDGSDVEVEDWSTLDAEGGEGVDAYRPLKFVAAFEFPSYDWKNATAGDGQPESQDAQDAATARFEFAAWSDDGTSSRFSTEAFSLRFEEVAPLVTPDPQIKCHSLQHGAWHGGRCILMKQLTRVCVQLVMDRREGWQLRVGRLAEGPGAPAGGPYGCSQNTGWAPQTYTVDTCWGPSPSRMCSSAEGPRHRVEVALRSAEDPLIRAEELTGNRFDFGPSAATERACGATFLAIGGLIAIFPLLRLRQKLRRARRQDRVDDPGDGRQSRDVTIQLMADRL